MGLDATKLRMIGITTAIHVLCDPDFFIIIQDMDDGNNRIKIHPRDIDLVCKWLQECKQESDEALNE
jgi:hypothetical protein